MRKEGLGLGLGLELGFHLDIWSEFDGALREDTASTVLAPHPHRVEPLRVEDRCELERILHLIRIRLRWVEQSWPLEECGERLSLDTQALQRLARAARTTPLRDNLGRLAWIGAV